MELKTETIKLAKEKGFQVNVVSEWIDGEENLYVPSTTQTELQTWLREERGVIVLVDFSRTFGYYYKIIRYGVIEKKYFGKYEEALEIGLQEALNN